MSKLSAIYLRILENGKVQRLTSDAGRLLLDTSDNKEKILRHFEKDPTILTRMVAERLGIAQ